MTKFECNREKARSNAVKHKITFTEAGRALKQSTSLTNRSPQFDTHGEERFISITKKASGRAIVVIWTPREENARIISVRHARKKEQEAFDAYLQKIQ